MDFGLVLPSSWNVNQIVESARVADEAGIDFLLLTDHYMTPISNESVDAWTVLAALAAQTQRIRLGTCVTPIPFRPPQMLAKIVATVDQLSQGRAILGVGAGWHRPEFDAYGTWDDDNVRVRKTIEGIQLILKLWTSKDPFDFDGQFYRVKGAILEPKPFQQPHPPLWFGTTGDYMLRVTKRYGDGWLPPVPGVPMQVYENVLAQLKGNSRQHGGKTIKVSFNGTLSELAEGIPKFAELGFDAAILVRTPREDTPQTIRKLAKDIIPSYRQH
jgi:alkanesulfonate monooxygenase SsuD/methylene tetrahydromethanopterin reductase-like flavin-dependent oxidoreductase (luciferase family)